MRARLTRNTSYMADYYGLVLRKLESRNLSLNRLSLSLSLARSFFHSPFRSSLSSLLSLLPTGLNTASGASVVWRVVRNR